MPTTEFNTDFGHKLFLYDIQPGELVLADIQHQRYEYRRTGALPWAEVLLANDGGGDGGAPNLVALHLGDFWYVPTGTAPNGSLYPEPHGVLYDNDQWQGTRDLGVDLGVLRRVWGLPNVWEVWEAVPSRTERFSLRHKVLVGLMVKGRFYRPTNPDWEGHASPYSDLSWALYRS